MISVKKAPGLDARGIQAGVTEVCYPAPDMWHIEDFYIMVDVEVALLRAKYAEYDREEVFGNHPCFRFFAKTGAVYPVTLRLESLLLKGEAFPKREPVSGIPLLTGLYSLLLTGACNADAVHGDPEFFLDPSGAIGIRDRSGTFFRMDGEMEKRVRAAGTTRHVLYSVLGAPGLPREELRAAQVLLEGCAKVLAPEARVESVIF